MKRAIIMLLGFLVISGLFSCNRLVIDPYTDDDPLVLRIDSQSVRILQLTDLHLTYGIDRRDQKTFELIRRLVSHEPYDLVVVTGDMIMSPTTVILFREFIYLMESLATPWTFVFGNHDDDCRDKKTLLSVIEDTTYLMFKVGPQITDGGYGNFEIRVDNHDNPLTHLYFFDTKGERNDYDPDDGKYDYLSAEQVLWYEDKVKDDLVSSLAFMHIPLQEYADVTDYEGTFGEDKVYFQGQNTGLFDVMVSYGLTKGVFVGHDHLNDYSFVKDGILLAYGRVSGYNAYGEIERGGRIIMMDATGLVTTSVIGESAVWA